MKLQDDLLIHLQGGALGLGDSNGTGVGRAELRTSQSVGAVMDKRRKKVEQLLDDVMREIGVYEEFVQRGM